jgi:hypothetical protein
MLWALSIRGLSNGGTTRCVSRRISGANLLCIFGTVGGLVYRFGDYRVIETLVSEAVLTGVAHGLATAGFVVVNHEPSRANRPKHRRVGVAASV